MNTLLLALSVAAGAADLSTGTAVAVSTPAAAVPASEPRRLFPPKAPARAKNSLDGAGEVARDLAASVEYFEAGQSYYRAYAKGTHSAEENAAFVRFLEEYEKEQLHARRTHAALGQWLERRSKVTD
jgi:hypothetical protein